MTLLPAVGLSMSYHLLNLSTYCVISAIGIAKLCEGNGLGEYNK